jgi:hypothetical protein
MLDSISAIFMFASCVLAVLYIKGCETLKGTRR